MTKVDVEAESWVQGKQIERQVETDTMNWGQRILKFGETCFDTGKLLDLLVVKESGI